MHGRAHNNKLALTWSQRCHRLRRAGCHLRVTGISRDNHTNQPFRILLWYRTTCGFQRYPFSVSWYATSSHWLLHVDSSKSEGIGFQHAACYARNLDKDSFLMAARRMSGIRLVARNRQPYSGYKPESRPVCQLFVVLRGSVHWPAQVPPMTQSLSNHLHRQLPRTSRYSGYSCCKVSLAAGSH